MITGLLARLDRVNTGPVRDGRLARPQRICVIGGGGSGKTTLGRQVARALGLNLTELDGSSGAGVRARLAVGHRGHLRVGYRRVA